MIKQFKTNEKHNSDKLHLDKYYTSSSLAEYCVNKTKELLGDEITSYLEPSAGSGVFLDYLPEDTLSYDIEPEDSRIIQADFISKDIPYEKGRCIIGNPPYGVKLNLARAFCDKSFEIADYVSFILPISQLNNTQTIYKFDLIHSEDLGKQLYSGKLVPCCLNIYKRPVNGVFNKKVSYKDNAIIEIREVREVIVSNNPKRNRELGDFQYDIAICAWGAVGKECSLGDYAKTFFIKIKQNKEYYMGLIRSADWKSLYPMTNTPNLLQWQVYKYIEDNRI